MFEDMDLDLQWHKDVVIFERDVYYADDHEPINKMQTPLRFAAI